MIERKEISYYILLIWLAVALCLAGVALIAVNLNQTVQEEGERAFHKNLKSISESAAKSVKLFMDGVISDIVFLTRLEAVKNYDTPRVDESFRSAIFRRKERISHMILLDGTGDIKVIVTKDPDPFQMSMQIREFFNETMRSWKVNISRRMFRSDTYPGGLAIGMPIFRKLQEDGLEEGGASSIYASGMVMALISMDDLVNNLIKPVRIGKSGFAWLYTGGGDVFGAPERIDGLIRSIYAGSGGKKRLAKEFGMMIRGVPVDGWSLGRGGIEIGEEDDAWFLSASTVNVLDQKWVMAVAAPRTDVTDLLTTSFHQSAMLVVFVVVILLAGGSLMTRVNRRLARAEEKALLAAELEEKNRSLSELNRRMDEFVSVVSHDIRSPLNVIRGFIKVIKSSPHGPSLERETKNMMRSCNRLTQLTSDILDISKLEAGKMRLAYDPIVLDNVIKESVQTMEFATKEKNLTTVIELNGETIMEGDSSKLLQVMNNLIGNAVKFTPKGGIITISKESVDGVVEIRVSDTGPGIDEKDRGIVFDKFEQVRRRQQGVEPGSGLGLSICKSIIELHGGAIGVTSRPGEGSTFHVTLPLKRPAREERKAPDVQSGQ